MGSSLFFPLYLFMGSVPQLNTLGFVFLFQGQRRPDLMCPGGPLPPTAASPLHSSRPQRLLENVTRSSEFVNESFAVGLKLLSRLIHF